MAKLLPRAMLTATEAASVRETTGEIPGPVNVTALVNVFAEGIVEDTEALTNLISAVDTGIRLESAVPKSKLAAVPSPRPVALGW